MDKNKKKDWKKEDWKKHKQNLAKGNYTNSTAGQNYTEENKEGEPTKR